MLSRREKAVLDFERSWWMVEGPKDRAILENLSMSATRYYQILRRLAEDPEAMEYDPLTVRRLQRRRALRAAADSERRLER